MVTDRNAEKWLGGEGGGSGEDAFDGFAGVDPGEACVEALEFDGEAGVVDAGEVEHGGVEVVHGDDVEDRAVAEFVGGTPCDAGFDAAAGEPHGEGIDVVVAAGALAHGGAAEFAAPDDERVVEHAAFLEVFDESGAGLVGIAGGFGHGFLDIAVMVPCAVVELNEADSAFGETACEEAIASEGAVAGFLEAVEIEDVLRFVAEVGEFRDTGLHAEGEFVLSDAGGGFRVEVFVGGETVEPVDFVDDESLGALADPVRVADVVDGVAAGLEEDSLIFARKEACAPLSGGDWLGSVVALGLRHEDDEAGEILGFCAEPVEEP